MIDYNIYQVIGSSGNPGRYLVAELQSLPAKVDKVLQLDNDMLAISEHFADKHNALFLGRGVRLARRLHGRRVKTQRNLLHPLIPSHKELLPFMGNESELSLDGIPFKLIDYLDLIDWTGRILRSDKRGAIPGKARSILESLSINNDAWVESVSQFEDRFGYAIGADRALKNYRHNLSTHWQRGQLAIQQLYRQTEAA